MIARANGLPFSRRKRTAKRVKMPTISRAKRSAGTAGWADWRMTLACSWHDRTTPARSHAGITRVRSGSRTAHDHGLHNGRTAPRAIEPHLHHGRRHNGRGHQKRHAPTLPSRPTVLPFSGPRAPTTTVKKPTISRAKQSAAMACWAGALGSIRLSNRKNGRVYGTVRRSGTVAQRGGHKAGEPVSSVWGRFAAPSGR